MYSQWPGQSGTATDVRARGAPVYTPSRTSKAARLEPFILTYSIAVYGGQGGLTNGSQDKTGPPGCNRLDRHKADLNMIARRTAVRCRGSCKPVQT
jgi:hypothetical protein